MSVTASRQVSIDEFVGRAPCVEQLRNHMAQVAQHDVNVLLEGETGTGKELVSRIIHSLSARGNGPFLGVNCAAIHETLLESELFGHEAGAFTGARHATRGFMRAADGGTILLDEVGDMSEALQQKLLRVLEERAVMPVGGTRSVPINVRVIAATNRNLAEAVKEGSFRTDLYYRLNVLRLWIPPLRQRRCDIPLLVEHMLKRIALALQVPAKQVSASAMDILERYDWPGNIRELMNIIHRAYVLCRNPVIDVQDLPEDFLEQSAESDDTFPPLREAVLSHVERALELSNGVQTKAAQMLGIHRTTLSRMVQRHAPA